MVEAIPHSIQSTANGVNITIQAKPNSKTDAITSIDDEVVGVSINAPPKEGEANKQLCNFMAQVLAVKKSCVSLAVGSKSKHKIISVKGVSSDTVYSKLNASVMK